MVVCPCCKDALGHTVTPMEPMDDEPTDGICWYMCPRCGSMKLENTNSG